MFKLWQRDKAETLTKMYDLDVELTKMANVVNNPASLAEIRQIFIDNYDYLKDVFLTLSISSGRFPYIGLQDFTRFLQTIGLSDNVLTDSRISTITHAVKVKNKQLDINVIKG